MFNKKRIPLFLSFCICIIILNACSNKKAKTSRPEFAGTVIILNGPSAIGKSSTIKAFQANQDKLRLSIGIGNFFVGVLPQNFHLKDTPEFKAIMHSVRTEDEQGKLFTLHIGPNGEKVIKGMHEAIAAYARAGNNVIVDYIMYNPAWRNELMKALQNINVIYVGITASLETIHQREKQRGTSPEGHGRSLHSSVHQGWDYDLKINTDEMNPDQIADKIIEFMDKK